MTNTKTTNKHILNRSRAAVITVLLLLGFLVYRLADLQLIHPDENRNNAILQYTNEVTINAKRGTIYDRTMQKLAVSTTVQTVFISPSDIKDDAQAELIINGLNEILGVEKDYIRERAEKKNSRYQIIKKNVEGEEEAAVRRFIEENDLAMQVCLEESSKRYYPFGTLASQVIGSVGGDNTGLNGIELTYNELLAGVNGRAIKGQDAHGDELPIKNESYIDSIDGTNIMLTLDYTVQSVLEKYLKQAYEDNLPNGGVRGIIMDVTNGEILAMANYPDYDLNNATQLSEPFQKLYDAYAADTSKTDEEKEAYRWDLIYEMWKNKTVTELYYPGSTFKMVTAAAALDEGTSTLNDTFNCTSAGVDVAGQIYHCHSTPHGHIDFSEALVKSCNPALITVGQSLGAEAFLRYFDSFGYTETTGSDVLGERDGIYHESLTLVDLATASFGQNMKISMLQNIRALSAIANGGYLVTPHLLKGYTDEYGNLTYVTDYSETRQAISTETADQICKILTNSTKNVSVNGYNIISKTGTTQKIDQPKREDTGNYWMISSCISFAPAEDPKIAILVVIDEPTGEKFFGSLLAAPVITNVLTEVLPYLGIEPTDDSAIQTLTVSDYRGSSVDTAKQALEQLGLKVIVRGDGAAVTDQMPRSGSVITEGGRVVLYTDGAEAEATVSVPNFSGMTPQQVLSTASTYGLNVELKGIHKDDYSCYVSTQSIDPGTMVTTGTIVTIQFIYNESIE